MPVREGLARLEGVESVDERCNREKGTGGLRLRQGRLTDPTTFAKQIADIRLGARLRGLEATVDGTLEKNGGKAVLRVSKSNELLQLAPLTTKVQIDALNTKKADPPSKDEKNAFKTLTRRFKGESLPVRVIGPLRSGMKLEVRAFELK